MEDIPKIIESTRLPLDIAIRPHLIDHCFKNRSVLPAVEAVEIMARAVKGFRPAADVTTMSGQQFDKFLYLDSQEGKITAYCDISVYENGDVKSVLATRTISKAGGFARIKEHAAAIFPKKKHLIRNRALDLASALEGFCFSIPGERIYRELVPLGPSFRNVAMLHLSSEGAIAEICSPQDHATADPSRQLGSPFVLDAAFHAACVWGQRFSGVVAFPVGVDQRQIVKPTSAGEIFFAHVAPIRVDPSLLIFDLRIYDSKGVFHEIAAGVRMRDVSGGTIKPPPWITAGVENQTTDRIAKRCESLSLIDLASMVPFADRVLSVEERDRFDKMGTKRKRSFLAGRLACKRISRQLSDHDTETDPREINTITTGSPRPRCPLIDGRSLISCSVAHDNRFAIAVASDRRVGVDVEKVCNRVLKSRRLYMHESEAALVKESVPAERMETAVRIWSIKEAVTKALDINLADAWHRVRVTDVGTYESNFQVDDDAPNIAVHDVTEKHVFTLVSLS